MKQLILFLPFIFICLNVHCQTGEKFNFKLNEEGTRYVVTAKSEKPIPDDARPVAARFLDERWLADSFVSIIEKSFLPDKLQKINELGVTRITITYSIKGKALKILMTIPIVCMDILNEDDLYFFYENLMKFEIDMSKIRLEYPYNWSEGTESSWMMMFPLVLKRKQ